MLRPVFLIIGILLVLSACRTKGEDGKIIGKEVFVTAMPVGGEVNDPDHGREAWLAVGPMEGTETSPANGVVTAHYFEDGTFILGIQVNIARAESGFFYEAWLVREGENDVSLGHLTNPLGDVRHQLRFVAEKDYRKYAAIAITRESDDGNPEPGGVVARAMLKKRER
ncbi:anti-sigma factor [Candidatus Peregrinibacteria bacterium]|nr:anti-sigma factor [Candidatus Peregrinibacteria bacterium]